MELFKRIKNFFLVWKFPYLKPLKYDGTPIKHFNYAWIHLDSFPEGWNKMLLKKFKELNSILKKYGELKNFHIVDSKEKYGTARIYFSGIKNKDCDKEVSEFLWKLETDSWNTCCICGRYADYISKEFAFPIDW